MSKQSLIESWREERRSIYLYEMLATRTENSERQLFQSLAVEADKQSQLWVDALKQKGFNEPLIYSPDLRTRFVGQLIKIIPPRWMRQILAGMKVRGMSIFLEKPSAHVAPQNVNEIGRRHHMGRANNLRAAIFGVNDGLISNASLVLGVSGGNMQHEYVLLAGIAGLLAGAFSMAAGEYISVRSQRELYEYQIKLEREELLLYPDEEEKELAMIYEARGLSKSEAENLSKTLMQDKEHALDILSREELGINPEELVSPWSAAIFSFLAFSIGAFIPIIPYLFQFKSALMIAIILTSLNLMLIGALVSLFTGRHAIKGAFRMLLIGLFAGSITYLIGFALTR